MAINYYDLFWKALEARVTAVWTDIDIQFSGTQLKRVNWREAIKADDFKVPFVAYALSPARGIDTAGMASRTNAYDVTIFYIRSDEQTNDEKTNGILIEDSIEAKLKDLQDDLYPTPSTRTDFQVVKQPDLDISAANAVNAVFVEASAPFLAGALHVEFVIGETN